MLYYLSIEQLKLEQVQYNVALAITGTVKCTSRSKCYKEKGLESLQSRRRRRHIYVLFIKQFQMDFQLTYIN